MVSSAAPDQAGQPASQGTDDAARFPCPCCGYLVFRHPPGSYDRCPICFWEDDASQLRWPSKTGANRPPLIGAQRNYAAVGAMRTDYVPKVRAARPEERRDPTWRRIDLARDDFEELPGKLFAGDPRYLRVPIHQISPYPEDLTRLYYWRPSFWGRR